MNHLQTVVQEVELIRQRFAQLAGGSSENARRRMLQIQSDEAKVILDYNAQYVFYLFLFHLINQ